MAKKPGTPCSGCGKLLWNGRGCLPAGRRRCRDCRRADPPREIPTRSATCEGCGETFTSTFTARDGRGWRRTCGRKCAQRVMTLAAAKVTTKPRPACEICGAEFRKTYGAQRTCGRACGAILHVRNRPASPPPPARAARACEWCSKPCTGRQVRWCSAECTQLARKSVTRSCGECGGCVRRYRHHCDPCRQKLRREARRRAERLRRARQRGVASEPYTLAYVAERDGFRCGICRRSVPMGEVVPHPKAPTIDHILPIAAGGDDTKANVQLAHFLCNSLKSDNASPRGDQLMLIG